MNITEFALGLGDPGCAVALGGCRALGPSTFDSCAYDVVLFDGNTGLGDTVVCCGEAHDERSLRGDGRAVDCGSAHVVVRHASMSERDSGRLLQYDMAQVVRDPLWDLRAMLRRVASKRDLLYRDFARNSLLQSMFYCQRVRESCNGAGTGDDGDGDAAAVFASCWQKCASFCLADAICAMNGLRPSPSHMLEMLRGLPKSSVNEQLSVVTETLGVERATPTLLRRMAASTAGFADHVATKNDSDGAGAGAGARADGDRSHIGGSSSCDNNNKVTVSVHGAGASPARPAACKCNNLGLILRKCDYFTAESLVTDCYFYLGYTNKENISRVQGELSRSADLSHMLKVALDVEMDPVILGRHTNMIQESCQTLLSVL